MNMILHMLQRLLPSKTYNAAKAFALSAGVAVLGIILVLLVGYVMASPTFGWTGRCPLHLLAYACVCINSQTSILSQGHCVQQTASFVKVLQHTFLLPHETT